MAQLLGRRFLFGEIRRIVGEIWKNVTTHPRVPHFVVQSLFWTFPERFEGQLDVAVDPYPH